MEDKTIQIEYELRRTKIKNVYIQIKDGKVIVKAPVTMSEERVEEIVEQKRDWIYKSLQRAKTKEQREEQYTQEEFVSFITQTVSQLVKQTGLHPTKVKIKELRYAWGSCTRNGHIALNSNLIKYSKEAISYVILHELCHLKYMNHSKSFWSLVEEYMPNYKEVRKEFKY